MLAAGRPVRPRFGRHPRLNVWGLLEARLQHADVVILGGLNEGSWPPQVGASPWMSRPMMRDFGLPVPERRIGLTAHDFAQAFSAPEVALTRAGRVEGTPTVPSRWLLRLENLVRGTPHAKHLADAGAFPAWQALLDKPGKISPTPRPEPRPPLAARPRELWVTQVETWMRDPYAVYARHILGLKALEPIDADPGAADYGTFIHDALDLFLKRFPGPPTDEARARLLDLGRETFGAFLDRPGVWAFWWPRFERVAEWFVQVQRDRFPLLKSTITETKGAWTIEAPGGPFTVQAKADRLDLLTDGTIVVVDYKTGAIPRKHEVAAGFAPQLPLEAAIAEVGGFEGLARAQVSALEYWRLKGTEPAGELGTAGDDVRGLIDGAVEGLRQLVAAFDLVDTPYESHPRPDAAPRYSDYEHLARIKEWSAGKGEE